MIAFISIRARYKLRGLINVSGFHVDPGFHGRLKFGVYNAGSKDLVMDRGAPVFAIWFAHLDNPNSDDQYNGHWQGQDSITAEDVMRLQGRVSSPAQLQTEITDLHRAMDTLRRKVNWMLTAVSSLIMGIALTWIVQALFCG